MPTLGGTELAGRLVTHADEFTYADPVDGSISSNQGFRVSFADSRIVFRLSGTGTEGATLRMYFETYEPDPARHDLDPQIVLADLIEAAATVTKIASITGRLAPSVIS